MISSLIYGEYICILKNIEKPHLGVQELLMKARHMARQRKRPKQKIFLPYLNFNFQRLNLERCYVYNIFTTYHGWLVIIGSNLTTCHLGFVVKML